jgi:hypothetical protein
MELRKLNWGRRTHFAAKASDRQGQDICRAARYDGAMEGNRFQFSPQRLFLSIACIAVGAAIVAVNLYIPVGFEDFLGVWRVLLSIPLVGACLGGCIGAVTERFWLATALGSICPIVILMIRAAFI